MRYVLFIALFFLTSIAQAQNAFSPSQIERIKAVKQLLGPVDKKTLDKTISELQKSPDPVLALELQETMSKVYTDIVAEKDVKDQPTREWLYGMIALNMANVQFGGRASDPLSRMIVQKLKKNLPPTVLSNPNFHVSVE